MHDNEHGARLARRQLLPGGALRYEKHREGHLDGPHAFTGVRARGTPSHDGLNRDARAPESEISRFLGTPFPQQSLDNCRAWKSPFTGFQTCDFLVRGLGTAYFRRPTCKFLEKEVLSGGGGGERRDITVRADRRTPLQCFSWSSAGVRLLRLRALTAWRSQRARAFPMSSSADLARLVAQRSRYSSWRWSRNSTGWFARRSGERAHPLDDDQPPMVAELRI